MGELQASSDKLQVAVYKVKNVFIHKKCWLEAGRLELF
jgi:hypothetical protein